MRVPALDNLVAVIMAVMVVSLVLPYGFPLVSPLVFVVAVIWALGMLSGDVRMHFDSELLVLYVAVFASVLLGVVHTGTLQDHVRGDVVNALTVLLLIPVLGTIVADGRTGILRDMFARYLFAFMLPVAFYCLYKFRMLLQGVRLENFVSLGSGGSYPVGTALQSDYNMAALGLSIGATAGITLAFRSRSAALRWLLTLGAAFMLITALLAGSRRFYVLFSMAVLVGASVCLVWIVRRAVIFLSRWRFRLSAAAHFGIGVVVVAVALTVFSSATGLLAEGGTQVDRLVYRFTSLLTVMEILEGGRGRLLADAIDMTAKFGLLQFAFGDGFHYLKALSVDGSETYPHNPFVSALLYGGIPALAFVAYFVLRATWIYAVKSRVEPFLAVTFFVTIAFALISGNSIFSSRLLLLMMVIGFMLRHDNRVREGV